MSLGFNGLYRFEDFELDPARRALLREGARVAVSPKAFEVLSYLVANPGRVIAKEELLKAVWPDSFVEEGNLAQYISGLRKALADGAGYIATIPGRGYQFTAKVERISEAAIATVPESLHPEPAIFRVQSIHERTSVIVDEVRMAPLPARKAATPLGVWIAVGAVVVASGASFAVMRARSRAALPPNRKIVLANFVNTTGNPAFDGTMSKALEIDLAQSPYMDVLGERASVNTLQLMGLKKDAAITPEIALEICERTNREAVVTGTLASVGQRYLMTLAATDCSSGKNLAAAKAVASSPEKVLDALDSAAETMRRGLNESAQSVASYEVPLRTATTASLDALKAYSTGMYLSSQGESPARCMAAFERAVELDPNFAMAYRMIGVENTYLGQTSVASENFQKAFELSGRVSALEQITIRSAYYSLGNRNLIDGIKANQLWASTYPDMPGPVTDEVDNYMTLGQWDRALEVGERALAKFPAFPTLLENLNTVYCSLNRFEDARRAALRAAEVGKGDTGLHLQLFLIAYAERDSAALARETAWFNAHDDGATVWYYPAFRGDGLASAGDLHQAEEYYRREYDAARRSNLPEAADGILIHEALAELKLGLPGVAKATLQRVREFGDASPEAAAVHAELGDVAYVERYLAAHTAPTPETLMTYVYLPRLRAAMALRRGKPLDAIAALEPARPYEMRDYSVPTLAAEAHTLAGQPDKAAIELRKIADNPGIDPTSVLYPMAHLGLARAYAAAGDRAASRKSYERFFLLFKDGDDGVPVLRQARAEYARLGP